MWDLIYSSLTRDGIHSPCSRSVESSPLDREVLGMFQEKKARSLTEGGVDGHWAADTRMAVLGNNVGPR